jgi:hypothetical protein
MYTIPGHTCLLSAREKTLDSVCQFLGASLSYVYIMIIYWVIFRNVAVGKNLLPESRKTLRWTVAGHGPRHHVLPAVYHSYLHQARAASLALDDTVATSGVNRLASQICHNQLFRKKLQQNILPIISTKVSSLVHVFFLCQC